MELEEFKMRMQEIDKTAKDSKLKLQKVYALSHCTVKIGDIVTDHIGSIVVRRKKIYLSSEPCCIYVGQVLTKAGKLSKREGTRSVYQSNLVEIKNRGL